MIGTSEHGQVVKSTELSLPAFRCVFVNFSGDLNWETDFYGFPLMLFDW